MSRKISFFLVFFFNLILFSFLYSFNRETNPHYGSFGPGYLTVLTNGQYGDGEIRSPYAWPSFGLKGVPWGARWNFKIYTNRNGTKWNNDLTSSAGMTINANMLLPKGTLTYTHSSLPVEVVEEVLCPLVPCDSKLSSLPVVFFNFRVKNNNSVNVEVAVAFQIPNNNITGTTPLYDGQNIKGLKINCNPYDAPNNSYPVGAGSVYGLIVNDGSATTSWGSNFTDGVLNNTSGSMVASKITLSPSQERNISFIFIWYFPRNYSCTRSDGKYIGGDHYYMNFYSTGDEMANDIYANYSVIKNKIERWFNNLMNSNLPQWLKTLISINNIPLIYNSCFFKSGIAALVESYDYNMTGTYDHQFYLSIGQLIFIPSAEWGEVKYFAEVQSPTGGIRHDTAGWGMGFTATGTDDDYGAYPDARNTWGDLTPKWLLNVYRDYLWTGDIASLTQLWQNQNIQKAVDYMINWDKDGDGLFDSEYNTYDNFGQEPENIYNNCLQAAAFKASAKIAEIMGDNTKRDVWNNRASMCSSGMESQLWDPSRNCYKSAPTDNSVMSGALAGQWYADYLYLGDILDKNRVSQMIDYVYNNLYEPLHCRIREFNWRVDMWNALPLGHYTSLAITRNKVEKGLDVAYTIYDNVYTKLGIQWSQPLGVCDCNDDCQAVGYMNPPVAWHVLCALMGLNWDIPNKTLWIQPHIPSSFSGKLKAPIVGGVTWGFLDYSETEPDCSQKIIITLDTPLQIAKLRIKNLGIPDVSVTKNGIPQACSISSVNQEFVITFSPYVIFDSTPVIVKVASGQVQPVKLLCNAIPSSLPPDGISISTVTASVCDSFDNVIINSTATIRFTLTGQGSLIGQNPVIAEGGVAKIFYRSGTSTGTVTITATSSGLSNGTVQIVVSSITGNNPPGQPQNLKCNGLVNPVDLEDLNPDFSWQFNDPDTGDKQIAYRLLVADNIMNINNNTGNIWDTNRVNSSSSVVTYAGPQLSHSKTYYWKVMTWDSFDERSPYSEVATFSISAVLLAPVLKISSSVLNFGEVPFGKTQVLPLEISNIGIGTLSGTIYSEQDWINITPENFLGNRVIANITVDNEVLSAREGDFSGKVIVDTNGGREEVIVNLTATCVLVKPNPAKADKILTFFGSGIVPYKTTIKIFSISGEFIEEISEIHGKKEIEWKPVDGVCSGIYIYIFESPLEKGISKFTILK